MWFGRVLATLVLAGCGTPHSECKRAPLPNQVLVNVPPPVCTGETWDVGAPFDAPEPWTRLTCPLARGGVFERSAERKLESFELSDFHARRSRELMEASGNVSSGISVCCRSGSADRRLCISLGITNCGATPAELLKRIDQMLLEEGLGDAALVVQIDAHAVLEGPRCPEKEAACEPERLHGSTRAYEPSKLRCVRTDVPVWPTSCKNDGECVIGGCGGCIPWTAFQPMVSCEEQVDELAYDFPFCGCVSGRCAWFKQ